ncbi:hypothetical protein B0H14DRAFT_3488650 [Mycena olivaceomarginata]|nr:hypothetical protein B0H14DRAFT_3488650 [Mycena olivaceomarginata]
MRVLFPTLETVRGDGIGREPGGDCVFCRRAQWVKIFVLVADHEVRARDARCTEQERRGRDAYQGLSMILGTLRAPPEPETDPDATDGESDSDAGASSDIELIEPEPEARPARVAVHRLAHFTPSAWGTLSGSGFSPVLNVTSYELGVVLRMETPEVAKAVAWELPARRYVRGICPGCVSPNPPFLFPFAGLFLSLFRCADTMPLADQEDSPFFQP